MIKHEMQGCIDSLVENANNIGFTLSATKATSVHLWQNHGNHPDATLIINGVRLLYWPVTKLLGLTFDKKLTWLQGANPRYTESGASHNMI